jgi:hypothetical protein
MAALSANWNEIWLGQISLLLTETHLVYVLLQWSCQWCRRIALVLDVSQSEQRPGKAHGNVMYSLLCLYMSLQPLHANSGFWTNVNQPTRAWLVTTKCVLVGYWAWSSRLSTRLSIRLSITCRRLLIFWITG